MCQTAVISNQIVRLGTQSFKQRLEAVSGIRFSVTRLSRLNKCLDDFYEFLYDQINSMTMEDYKKLGHPLSILVSTLKELYETCLVLPKAWDFDEETVRLGRNYSAFNEIERDLRTFKSSDQIGPDFLALLDEAGSRMNRLPN